MKRLTCTLLLAAMLFGLLGSGPAPAQAQTGSPADLMPDSTWLYAEVDTSNLMGVIDQLVDLAGRAGIPVSSQVLLAALDSGLSATLQGASFSQDVLPWLGPSMAAGIMVVDDLPAGQPFAAPEGLFIATVTDDTAARSFLDNAIATVEGRGVTLQRIERTLNGAKIVGYAYEQTNIAIAWMPGYLMAGPLTSFEIWFENLEAGGPVLSGQGDFDAIWSQFRPGSLVKGYVSGQWLDMAMESAWQNQSFGAQERAVLSALDLFGAFQAFGFALRGEGRSLAFDLIGSVDTAREAQVMEQAGLPPFALNPNGGRLAARIPSNAFAVIDWGDLAGLVDYLRNVPSFEQQFDMLSQQLQAATQIDLEQDVLSWMGGEFAMYIALNVDAVLQGDTSFAPFAWTLLFEVDDRVPVRRFLDRVEALLTDPPGDVKPAPFTRLEEDYYVIEASGAEVGSVAFGLVNGTFVLTLGGDPGVAAAAARGDGTLDQTTAWQHVVEEVPAFNQPVFFLNFDVLNGLLNEAMSQNTQSDDPGLRQFAAVLNLFEGALIYGSDQGDGNVFATAALMLREPLQ